MSDISASSVVTRCTAVVLVAVITVLDVVTTWWKSGGGPNGFWHVQRDPQSPVAGEEQPLVLAHLRIDSRWHIDAAQVQVQVDLALRS